MVATSTYLDLWTSPLPLIEKEFPCPQVGTKLNAANQSGFRGPVRISDHREVTLDLLAIAFFLFIGQLSVGRLD